MIKITPIMGTVDILIKRMINRKEKRVLSSLKHRYQSMERF